jgi:hypothetical protein
MAHIVRAMYYEDITGIPEWKKKIVNLNKERIGFLLEPRILEHVVLFLYRIYGDEALWIPRILSSVFWLIGGVFLYLMVRDMFDFKSGFISLVYYLFLPFSITASRSFQPDPMMLMFLIAGLYGICQYFKSPAFYKLIISAVPSTLAIILKPYSVFLICGAFVFLTIKKHGLRSLLNVNSIFFISIIILPGAIYYLSGIISAKGLIKEHTSVTFLPHLLIKPYFYKDWFAMIGRVTGWIAFALGALSLLMIKDRLHRFLLYGLWIGYIIFGLLFTYHIHTHDYYQLPLIPVVALSLGGLGHHLINSRRIPGFIIIGILSLVAFIGYPFYKAGRDMSGVNKYIVYVTGASPYLYSFLKGDYNREIRMYKEIGKVVNHSAETVFLTSDFGRSLSYYGELSGLPWPNSSSLRERREAGVPIPEPSEIYNKDYLLIRTHGKYIRYRPDYFIITDFEEFERQQDLKKFLYSNFPVFSRGEGYLIFDLRTMIKDYGDRGYEG